MNYMNLKNLTLLFVTAFYSIGSFLPEEYAQYAIITNALAAIFDLFRLKCEYNGHQTISTHFDCNLSESYERLWKWYLILPAARIVSGVLLYSTLFRVIAAIVMILSYIGEAIIRVLHIYNLFRLKKLFS